MNEESLRSFYEGKKIFITGHTGFKGAWLTQILLGWGAVVCGYSLEPNTDPNLFDALSLSRSCQHNIGDIRDIDLLKSKVMLFSPDIIFHLAAQPLVRDSYQDPVYTYDVNIMGTVNMLEVMRQAKIKAGVMITTDKVYQNLEKDIAYKEDDPLGGYDPYSNSKACADLVVSSYISSFFNPDDFASKHNTLVASARSGNVIGGGDWSKDRLIPDLIKAFLVDNKDIIIRSPEATRPWQHVLEPLCGYLLLGKALFGNDLDAVGAWNFGPCVSDALPVAEVVQIAIDNLKKGRVSVQRDNCTHEVTMLKLDNTKARGVLGWKPKFDVSKAISETLKWYEKYYSDQLNINEFMLGQIDNYFGEELV
ncbi:MAG: CDP-glucose 4,6-dehydratase [Candidatus Heimdallarchaeota archaeon]|nr:CDP-glucose 4,6-dehydratase [Candidatus Heimdallarchaeota archaeon]